MSGTKYRLLASFAAVAVGLGVSQLITALLGASANPWRALALSIIDAMPRMLKDWTTRTFDGAFESILCSVVAIIVGFVLIVLGALESPSRPIGTFAVTSASAVGCAAVLSRDGADVNDLIPILAGACAAVAALRYFVYKPRSSSASGDNPNIERRDSIVALGMLGIGMAAGAGASARILLSNSATPDLPATGMNNLEVVLNVKLHGAVGDGYSDDAHALQALIDSLPNSGGTVLFPAGTYNVGTTILCNKPVTFLGVGSAVSILRLMNSVELLSVHSTSNVRVENLQFNGNRMKVGRGNGTLLMMTGVSNITIRGCRFVDGPSTAVFLTNVDSAWVIQNRFSNIYHSGVRLGDPGEFRHNDHIWICDNHFDTCQAGDVSGNAAIQTHGTGTISHRYLSVLNNIINNPKIVGIGVDSLDRSRVSGNVVVKDQSCSNGEAIAFTGSENVLSENYCYNLSKSSAAGILCWAVEGRSNEGNQIINNRVTNSGQGIGFTWGENGAAISDLLIYGNYCYGNNIGIQSWNSPGVTTGSQSNVMIANNNLVGNSTEAINLVQNGAGGITGNPKLFGQPIDGLGEQWWVGNSDLKLDGSWNAGHLLLGSYHLWVDAGGSLRINSSAPISDTDGTIVGAEE